MRISTNRLQTRYESPYESFVALCLGETKDDTDPDTESTEVIDAQHLPREIRIDIIAWSAAARGPHLPSEPWKLPHVPVRTFGQIRASNSLKCAETDKT